MVGKILQPEIKSLIDARNFGALREVFAQKERLVFMDFITDQTENVFPMVPGGMGLTEMILAEEL